MTKTQDTIILLSDLDKVRERPGMYIGDNGALGLATIVREVIDNAIDEYANYPDPSLPVVVTLHADQSVSVQDFGRGISPYESKQVPGELEHRLAYTRLGAGGKFKANRTANNFTFSGGLNGVGATATNAVSDYFEVTIVKDGYQFFDRFEDGQPITPLKKGKLPKTKTDQPSGTTVHFKPSRRYLTTVKIDADALHTYFQEQAYLHPGMTLIFINERDEEEFKYYEPDGLVGFVTKLCHTAGVKPLTNVFDIKRATTVEVQGTATPTETHIAFALTDGTHYETKAFTNGIFNSLGGTHVNGLNRGLAELFRHYFNEFGSTLPNARKIPLIKKVNNTEDVASLITPRLLSSRMVAVIDFKHIDPILQPQTKDRLASAEATKIVADVVADQGQFALDKEMPAVLAVLTSLIDELYEKAEDDNTNIKLDKKMAKTILSTKLAQARGKKPENLELILVEGDSAAGTLKANRDANFQAILPLRGKVLNVHKATLTKALGNQEIATIFAALGVDFGRYYDPSKLKYHKVIIGTDQDVDGKHIRVLLLTLFMKYTPRLVLDGHVYFLDTPLFVNYLRGNKKVYTYSEAEQVDFLKSHKPIDVERNKGLGELSAEQSIETILEPDTRRLTQLVVEDEDQVYELIDLLMGEDTAYRKQLFSK